MKMMTESKLNRNLEMAWRMGFSLPLQLPASGVDRREAERSGAEAEHSWGGSRVTPDHRRGKTGLRTSGICIQSQCCTDIQDNNPWPRPLLLTSLPGRQKFLNLFKDL